MKKFFESVVIGMEKGAAVALVIAFIVFLFWLDKVCFIY